MSAPIYIFGKSQSCERHHCEPVVGKVKGKIPKWLEGTLICNGPGIFKIGKDRYNHVFDGLSVLHRFHFENGQVTYSYRALESDTYKRNMKAERIIVSEFGTASFPDPCKNFFEKLRSRFSVFKEKDEEITDNCNVSVGYYGDQLYAMTESNLVRRIDPKDLKTMGEKTWINDYVAVNQATAHPHILEDGSVLNMGNNYRHNRGPHYCIFKIPANSLNFNDGVEAPAAEGDKLREKGREEESAFKEAKLIAEIPCSSWRYPSYYHSFGVTEKYIVFIESPLRINVMQVLKGRVMGQPIASAMFWDSTAKTKFHVVSLETGRRLPFVYESESFFTLHHINAYEDKEKDVIIVDVAAYNSGNILVSILDNKEHRSVVNEGNIRRFALPLNTNSQNDLSSNSKIQTKTISCEASNLTKQWMDFPRINYKYNGRPYNYFYAMENADCSDHESVEVNVIAKFDIKRLKAKRWSEAGKLPSEPIFVATNNKSKIKKENSEQDEDDGVILTALLHKEEPSSVTLLILDAKTFKEIARIIFKIQGSFTGTLHGKWAQRGDKIHIF